MKLAKMQFVFLLVLMLTYCDSRTVDVGREDIEVIAGLSPLLGAKNLPLLKESEGGLAPGINDIQGGLMDKADGVVDKAYEVEISNVGTTENTPTVSEFNDIESLDAVAEEKEEEKAEVEEPDDADDDFDPDIFEGEGDLLLVMRRMYEALTSRLNLLKGRVSTVEQTTSDILARLTDLDCSDLQTRGQKESGVYTLHMDHNGKRPVSVACDMETDGGGWTVIQKRTSQTKDVDFNRGWFDYKMGFGNVSSDYWIGLENIYIWTNTRHYELRIDLSDFAGVTAYAHYDHFYIESEDRGYRLHISGYSGTSGDSMGNEGKLDNFTADGMLFTTHDEDHDTSHEINCAKYWKIGGWWFNRCSWANLNGPYREPGEGDGIGINWHMWRNKEYLRTSQMMIRPTRNF